MEIIIWKLIVFVAVCYFSGLVTAKVSKIGDSIDVKIGMKEGQ